MSTAAAAPVTPLAAAVTITGEAPAIKITPVADPTPAPVAAVTPAPAAEAVKPAEPASTAETPAASKAPEKYALALPTGSEAWLDASDIAAVEATAREAGLSNEEAQDALDRHADSMAARSAQFRAVVESDPVYGGANLQQTQQHARAFLDRVRPAGTPAGDEIRRLLAKTGYGNNLAIVSLFADTGKMMAEDTPVGGRTTVGTIDDAASKLYAPTK